MRPSLIAALVLLSVALTSCITDVPSPGADPFEHDRISCGTVSADHLVDPHEPAHLCDGKYDEPLAGAPASGADSITFTVDLDEPHRISTIRVFADQSEGWKMSGFAIDAGSFSLDEETPDEGWYTYDVDVVLDTFELHVRGKDGGTQIRELELYGEPTDEQPEENDGQQDDEVDTSDGTDGGISFGRRSVLGSGSDGDYYVAMDGDDTGPGTIERPLRTFQEAVERVEPGDTVYVREGTYGGARLRDVQGTADAPIVFSAYPGEHVTFDAQRGSIEGYILLLYGENHHLVFDGFEMTNSDPRIDEARELDLSDDDDVETWREDWLELEDELFIRPVRINPYGDGTASHIIFRNMHVHDVLGVAFSLNSRATDLTVEHSHIHDIGLPRSGYAVYHHGDRFTFRGNIVERATTGLHIYGGDNHMEGLLVEGNLFSDIGREPFWHMSSARVKSGGTSVLIDGDGSGSIVRNNIIVSGRRCLTVDTSDSLVAHNLIYDCQEGIIVEADGVRVLNNIVHSTGNAVSGSSEPASFEGNSFSDIRLIDERDPASGLTARPGEGADAGVTFDALGVARDATPTIGPFELD